MARIRSKNTRPELAVRRLVHRLGFRFRLHRKDIPGRPDLAFIAQRKAIFVHGCFWHSHVGCPLWSVPTSRPEYWLPKLERNRIRDQRNLEALRRRDWRSLVVWECELRDATILAQKLMCFLNDNAATDVSESPKA